MILYGSVQFYLNENAWHGNTYFRLFSIHFLVFVWCNEIFPPLPPPFYFLFIEKKWEKRTNPYHYSGPWILYDCNLLGFKNYKRIFMLFQNKGIFCCVLQAAWYNLLVSARESDFWFSYYTCMWWLSLFIHIYYT